MNPTVWTIGVTITTFAFLLGLSTINLIRKKRPIDRAVMAATSAAAVSLTGLALLLYIAANQ